MDYALYRNAIRAAFLGVLLMAPLAAAAHCDTLDGPVVVEARLAIEKGDVTPLLKWVPAGDEAEIRKAFQETLAVRTRGPEAKDLADRYFFETLVRIHRAGEGAPYTGLKPAGEVPPGIALGDKAMEKGSLDDLQPALLEHLAAGLKERFAEVMEAKKHAGESVEKGREFVAAYVVYIHYVEGLVNAIHGSPARAEDGEPKTAAGCGHKR